MALSVSLHWMLVPTLFVLLHVLQASPQAGWTTLVLTYLLFSGLFYLRYRGGKWRSIRVVEAEFDATRLEGRELTVET
jgi:MATE family multidrug resistance protein